MLGKIQKNAITNKIKFQYNLTLINDKMKENLTLLINFEIVKLEKNFWNQ